VVAGIEVDHLVVAQSLVAKRGQAEQAAKRWDRAGRKARQLQHLLAGCEPQFPPALGSPHGMAVKLPVCRDDEHDEAVFTLADEGLGSAGQRRAPDSGGFLAGVDRLVPQRLERDAVLVQQALYSLEHRLRHDCSHLVTARQAGRRDAAGR
jgi:hypothetical protein